ncbi:hypothetical protein LCM08_03995 [Salipiger pacificus]|nr:hypothetical protein [Alloyangia pacifica]
MSGNNGFRVPDPFERSYGGAAPWEEDRDPEAEVCETCGGQGEIVGMESGSWETCHECDGEGTV